VKLLVVIGVAVVTFLSSAVAVAGATTTLSGTAEWTGPAFPDLETSTVVHGTFDGKLGKGTYEGTLIGWPSFITTPCDLAPFCEPVAGTITFWGHRGSFTGLVQPGALVGLQDIASHSWRYFDLTLRVTDGTRSYKNATGLLSLTYTSTWAHYFDADAGQFISTISDEGTLTGDLR
jgi:hypothetical protein